MWVQRKLPENKPTKNVPVFVGFYESELYFEVVIF